MNIEHLYSTYLILPLMLLSALLHFAIAHVLPQNYNSYLPSGVSCPRSSWREKLDPFSDDEAELRDGQKAHRCWCYWCSSIPSKMRLAITVGP